MKKRKGGILAEKARRTCENYGFYRDGERTLVGFSGGADSVSLLHFLVNLLGSERITAVHINHMLRDAEADRDEEFCRRFCAECGVELVVQRIDVAARCDDSGIEETARNIRYAVFREEAEKHGCATVSLAHTASDNLETMLFHLCRGAGLDGLSGIPPVRMLGTGRIVRPLIDCTREDVLAYTEENSLPYVTDATNADTRYTRNFIRHEIVPRLKQVGAAVEENARQAAVAAADAAAFIAEDAVRFLSDGGYTVEAPIEALCTLPAAVRYPVLNLMYQNAGGKALAHAQAAAVQRLLSERKKGHSADLTGDITAKIDGNMLRFLAADTAEAAALPLPMALTMGKSKIGAHIRLYLDTTPPAELTAYCRFEAHTRIPASSLPTLHARARQSGEHCRTGGMTRSLKKLLCGADSYAKARPLICDGDGILWLPGFCTADRAQDGEMVDLFYLEL